MLDPRIYRASLLPVLLALIVVAFALQDRPRPIGTTLAPDAFDGRTAAVLLDDLARAYPSRRPGSVQDEALARRVQAEFRRALRGADGLGASDVHLQRFSGHTLDGTRDLVNVVATRPGRPGPGIVFVAHRDAAGSPAKAELSGTAALIVLARIVGSARPSRTITFISTTGGSGGAAGARAAARDLPGDTDAVIVLGDVGSLHTRKPYIVPFSSGPGVAPVQLRRTLEASVRLEAGTDPGSYRVATQWARQAFPVTVGEQGPFGAAGLPAVLLSASGERGPAAGAPVSARRLQSFGRAALRTMFALDNGPTITARPHPVLQTARKLLSVNAIRLLGAALLLPVLLVTLDGFARARRRREPVGRRITWVLATALPFMLAAAAAVVLGLVGLIEAPRMAVPAHGLELDGAAVAGSIAILLIFLLGWLFVRPLALRVAGQGPVSAGDDTAAPAVATLVVACVMAVAIWVRNPFAAVLLAPALHLWLLAMTPDWRWPRAARLAAVLAGLLPFALVAWVDASSLGYSLRQAVWQGVLLVTGGQVGPVRWVAWGIVAGCAVCAGIIALHPGAPPAEADGAGHGKGSGSVRGPGSYAGPGSLGGVPSALKR